MMDTDVPLEIKSEKIRAKAAKKATTQYNKQHRKEPYQYVETSCFIRAPLKVFHTGSAPRTSTLPVQRTGSSASVPIQWVVFANRPFQTSACSAFCVTCPS